LADAINGCNLSPQTTAANPDEPFWSFYAGLSFARSSLSGYDTYIQQYASNQNWKMVLLIKRLAEEDGYDSPTIDNATLQALSNIQMLENLPATETWGGGTWFADYDRYILNAYRYAQQYGLTAKWNQTAAYQELLNTYNAIGRTVYGYNPITLTGYLNDYVKYYDTLAQTLDCFVKLGGTDDGLWTAMNTLGNVDNCWTGTIYGYPTASTGGQYECEFGFFALIIGYYYMESGKTIPYFDRVYQDLFAKAVADGWNSLAWGRPGVIQHATSNPELRMPNTLGAVLALQGYCGSSSWESAWANMLTGSTAWQGLLSSYLYSNGQFLWGEGASPTAEATMFGMKTLFLYGIIPNTGSLAIPLNDEAYEGAAWSSFPSSLFSFDYANRMIRIAVNPGEIKFQYGTGIASYVFPAAGVYDVQFDDSWDTVTGASLVEPLPSLFQYLSGNISSLPSPNPPIANFSCSPSSPVTGEPVTFDASSSLSGWNGTNTMPIVLYGWDFGDGNTSSGQIVTHKYLQPGNYTVSLNVTDSEGLWNLTAQQIQIAPLPFSVSIGPSSSAIPIGGSIIFTSTVNGGVIPYGYQWYLNGDPVSGATNSTWAFSPTTAGSSTICVAVTDSATTPASAQSDNASVTAAEGVQIMGDGSVVPSSAPISSLDNVTYTFTDNISYPTYYGVVVERSNIVIDGNGYTVQGNSPAYSGISLTDISNVTIENINVEDFQCGIQLYASNNNTIIMNNVTANTLCGIGLDSSSNNNVIANNVANNSIGLSVQSASNNTIYQNNFIANDAQTSIDSTSLGNAWNNGYPSGGNYWSDYNGTDMSGGPYQNVTGSDGIGDTPYLIAINDIDQYPLMYPYSTSSLSVIISPPSTTLDVGQTRLLSSVVSGGTLAYSYQWYLNGTPVQGAVFSSWTFAPTSAGSYIFYMEVTDSLGQEATSNTANVTVNIYDVAITNVAPIKTVVGQSYGVNVTVTAANLGSCTETCNVTVCTSVFIASQNLNLSFVTSQDVTLPNGNSLNITFVLNTVGYPYGNYTISAYAWPVFGETNAANNNVTTGTVYVGIPGDINGDGTVDIYDAILLSGAFGSHVGSPNWNPNADINGDGIVDIYDAIIQSNNFNQHIS